MKDSCVVKSVDLFQFMDSRLSTTGLRRMVEVRRLKRRDKKQVSGFKDGSVTGMFQAFLEIYSRSVVCCFKKEFGVFMLFTNLGYSCYLTNSPF